VVRVKLSPKARAEIRAAARWWQKHGLDVDFLRAEIDRGLEQIAAVPLSAPVHRTRPTLRRLLLRRIQHWIYFELDDERALVVTFWHVRRDDPDL